MKLKKPNFWDKQIISIWAILLFPVSIIYLILVWISKISSIFKTYNHSLPIICVGNIYVGGTGKTPLAVEIFKFLKSNGRKPSFIKKHYDFLIDEIKMLQEIGDTYHAKKRKIAIELSKFNGNDVAILDDGFQDFSIKPNFSILCFNSKQIIGNGFVIPSGPLREGLNAINRADCIVINGGNYLTITPAHADDYFRFEAGVSYYIPANNAYGGLGFMTSTATDFSANRNFFFRSGQHSMGNGSAGGDEYNFEWIHWAGKASEIGLTAGTTYYARTIGQKHSTSNTLIFNAGNGNGNDRQHYMQLQHWKKQT